jgi:hypothetical protein
VRIPHGAPARLRAYGLRHLTKEGELTLVIFSMVGSGLPRELHFDGTNLPAMRSTRIITNSKQPLYVCSIVPLTV